MREGGPGPNWTASQGIGAPATYGCGWHGDGRSAGRPTQAGSLTGARNKPHLTDHICHIGWPALSPPPPIKGFAIFQ